jgi:hypothetical protein
MTDNTKKKVVFKMKIVDVQPYVEARQFLKKRACWKTCFFCKKKWSEIYGTETTPSISMFHILGPKGPEARFSCDECAHNVI